MNTGLDAVKTASKKVVNKAGEFLGNITADTVTKSNDDEIVKQEPVEEIMIPQEKKRDNLLNELRKDESRWIPSIVGAIYAKIIPSILKICLILLPRYPDYSRASFLLVQMVRPGCFCKAKMLCTRNKNLRFKPSVLRSDLCDYSYAYIVVKGTITVEGGNNAKINK